MSGPGGESYVSVDSQGRVIHDRVRMTFDLNVYEHSTGDFLETLIRDQDAGRKIIVVIGRHRFLITPNVDLHEGTIQYALTRPKRSWWRWLLGLQP